MPTLSTHVLDTALGKPAPGIPIRLERDGAELGSAVTDADGRARDLVPRDPPLPAGVYRLVFQVGDYFRQTDRETLFGDIVVEVVLANTREHYHLPLLLSPFGYSTYRGS